MSRHAGVMMPLFSAASARSWGAGELPDLAPFARWLASAGFDRLLILPIGVVPVEDTSPYSAMSAMAIDPMYIALDDVPEWVRGAGLESLDMDVRADLAAARNSPRVRYREIRRAKTDALATAFERFVREEWSELTLRASEFAGYIARERWWLDDFALYQAVAEMTGQISWRDWPAPLRDRDPEAIDNARRSLTRQLLKHQYLQWLAETQWQRARADAHASGVTVFGDLPFMVAEAGPDVWLRPDEFMLDVSLGVPPDVFSATGQDWGLPTYRWDRIAATGYAWVRQRARRMAALYDGYRVDHLVGLYRTFGRPADGEPFFNPGDEAAQTEQGEQLLRIFLESGAEIVAEDLGLVPDFIRTSLARVGVPGCKVLRWERDWYTPGQPFIDPRTYPESSAAMTGTHDTLTLADWWTGAQATEREALVTLLHRVTGRSIDPSTTWNPALHDALLATMYSSASREVFLPIQDVFGWTDRINTPGTIGDHNWTWKLPWPVDQLARVQAATAIGARTATLANDHNRGAGA